MKCSKVGPKRCWQGSKSGPEREDDPLAPNQPQIILISALHSTLFTLHSTLYMNCIACNLHFALLHTIAHYLDCNVHKCSELNSTPVNCMAHLCITLHTRACIVHNIAPFCTSLHNLHCAVCTACYTLEKTLLHTIGITLEKSWGLPKGGKGGWVIAPIQAAWLLQNISAPVIICRQDIIRHRCMSFWIGQNLWTFVIQSKVKLKIEIGKKILKSCKLVKKQIYLVQTQIFCK